MKLSRLIKWQAHYFFLSVKLIKKKFSSCTKKSFHICLLCLKSSLSLTKWVNNSFVLKSTKDMHKNIPQELFIIKNTLKTLSSSSSFFFCFIKKSENLCKYKAAWKFLIEWMLLGEIIHESFLRTWMASAQPALSMKW